MQDRGHARVEVTLQFLVTFRGQETFQVAGQKAIAFFLNEATHLSFEGIACQVVGNRSNRFDPQSRNQLTETAMVTFRHKGVKRAKLARKKGLELVIDGALQFTPKSGFFQR